MNEKIKKDIDDNNLQLLVLLNVTIERIEFLEKNGYIFGNIKNFLKNSKTKYEEFLSRVFGFQEKIDNNSALQATNKLFVMQERVELALINQYMLTVDERKERTKGILSKYMISPIVDKVMIELEEANSFNF